MTYRHFYNLLIIFFLSLFQLWLLLTGKGGEELVSLNVFRILLMH